LTPTAAAKAIVKRSAVNDWKFWYTKDMNGEWIRLSDFRWKASWPRPDAEHSRCESTPTG